MYFKCIVICITYRRSLQFNSFSCLFRFHRQVVLQKLTSLFYCLHGHSICYSKVILLSPSLFSAFVKFSYLIFFKRKPREFRYFVVYRSGDEK